MKSRVLHLTVPLGTVLFAVLLLSLAAPGVQAQEPGVTVINVSPEFSALDIGTRGGLHYIEVVVSDYNSFGDIFRVDVEVLNEANSRLAHIQFLQYAGNNTTQRQVEFIQPVGGILVQELSGVSYSADPQTIEERTEMEVIFVISQVEGRWLRVTATDLGGLSAFAQVEYLSGTIGGAPAIPPIVLIMLAMAASVVIVSTRLRREQNGV